MSDLFGTSFKTASFYSPIPETLNTIKTWSGLDVIILVISSLFTKSDSWFMLSLRAKWPFGSENFFARRVNHSIKLPPNGQIVSSLLPRSTLDSRELRRKQKNLKLWMSRCTSAKLKAFLLPIWIGYGNRLVSLIMCWHFLSKLCLIFVRKIGFEEVEEKIKFYHSSTWLKLRPTS